MDNAANNNLQVSPREHLTERLPGTEYLVDLDHHSSLCHEKNNDIVLIPQPSKDPIDPLNWTPTWKYTVVIVQFCYTFISVTAALSVAPLFPLFEEEFHLSQTRLDLLSGATILAQGFANLILVPYANIFGRRQCSITLVVLTILTEVWEALATSDDSLLAARVCNGFVTATSEAIMVQVINDVFFSHQRGLFMGIYFATYFLGVSLGGIIAGSMGQRYGWRSFFWLSVGLSGFNFLTLLFLFPETKFKRSIASVEAAATTVHAGKLGSNDEEKGDSSEEAIDDSSRSLLGRGSPRKRQFALWQRPDSDWKAYIIRDCLTPIRIFLYPIIFWSAATAAGSMNMMLFYLLLESEILAAPPYNFSPASVGYSNFGFFCGCLIGLLTAGPFSDYVTTRAARKNGGVREAEMRLPALIPFAIISAVGMIVGNVALQRQWPWPVLVVVGFGSTGIASTTVSTIAVSYAIDCYKPISGEIMVVVTIVKNTCGFGMSYWEPGLGMAHGFLTPGMVQWAVAVGPLLFGVPMYFFGKKLRLMTKGSHVHSMAEF